MSRVVGHSAATSAPASIQEGPDPELASIERVNEAMAKLKATYVAEWAPASLAEMEATVGELSAPRSRAAGAFERLYRLAHDMKGQGATFGYSLITQIGEALCRLTADRDSGSEGEVALLRAHIEAAKRILDERLDDSARESGERILDHLANLRRRTAH